MIDLYSLAINGYYALFRRGVINGDKDLKALLDIKPFHRSYSKKYFEVIADSFIIELSEERTVLDGEDPRLSEYKLDNRNGLYRRVAFACATFSEENTAIVVAKISNSINLIGQKQEISAKLIKEEFLSSLVSEYLMRTIEKHSAYIVQEELKALGIIV